MFYANLLVVIVVLCHGVASLQAASAATKRSVAEDSVISSLEYEEKSNRDFQSTVRKNITHFQPKHEEMRSSSNEEQLKNRDFQSTILKALGCFQTEIEEMRNSSNAERLKDQIFQAAVLKSITHFQTKLEGMQNKSSEEGRKNREFHSTILRTVKRSHTKLRKFFSFNATELQQEVIRQREMSSISFERILSKLYCSSQYRYFGHSCFKLSNTSVDWETAKRKCLEDNSHVVSMDSHGLRSLLGQESLKTDDIIWAGGKDTGKGMGAILSSNLLTTDHVALLREWFPGKTFKLLYRATRDGMKPSVFHSRCNNKGPTISIGKDSTSGTTFGGYASVSWTSVNDYKPDNNAFVFRLCRQGCTSVRYSQYWFRENALRDHYKHGPFFGGGIDLLFFYGSHSYDSSNKYFPSNGRCSKSTYNGELGCGRNVKWTDVEVWNVVDAACEVFNPSTQNLQSKECSDKARYICEHQ